MALSSSQLAQLRQDLTILAVIQYESVLDELLDHYASLTEQKMMAGLSFNEASKWAWAEMGSGVGIQQVQTDFEESIRKRHVTIMKSYFGWPTLLTTTLIATLVYLITPLVHAKIMNTLLTVFWALPIFILGYRTKTTDQPDKWKFFQAHLIKSTSVFLYISVYGGFFFRDFIHTPTEIWLFRTYSTIGVVLCCLSLIYSISLFQLFRENFKFQLPKLSMR